MTGSDASSRRVGGPSTARPGRRSRASAEQGTALAIVVGVTAIVVALALWLALSTAVESDIAGNVQEGVRTMALAEAGGALVSAELARAGSWDGLLAGPDTTPLFDGAAGVRRVGDATVNLGAETARLLCGAPECSGQDPDTNSAERPWGRNNPRWRVVLSGPAAAVLGDAGAAPGYVVGWVADDPGENDGDPLRDGGPPEAELGTVVNPGAGSVAVRVVAWGPRSRRQLELVFERANVEGREGLWTRVWREVRGRLP